MKELKKLVLLAVLLTGAFTLKAESANTLKVGDVSPEIILSDANQVQTSLSSLRGNVVLLRFWASWDQISRKSNKDMVWLYNNHKNRKYNGADGLLVYNVSLDTDKAKWAKAIQEDQLNGFYNVNDFESQYVTSYNVKDLPTSFLLDENGIVIGRDMPAADMNRVIAGKYASAYPLANRNLTTKAVAQPLKNVNAKPLKPGESYRIQLGAYKKFVNNKFYNVTKFGAISSEKTSSGMTRVLVGQYGSLESAASALQGVKQEGYNDAFVVMYRNDKRVKIVNKNEVAAAMNNLNSYQTVANTTTPTAYEQPMSYSPPSQQQGLDYWEGQTKVAAKTTQRTGVDIDPFDNYNSGYNYQEPIVTTTPATTTQPYGVSDGVTTVYDPPQQGSTTPYQRYSTETSPTTTYIPPATTTTYVPPTTTYVPPSTTYVPSTTTYVPPSTTTYVPPATTTTPYVPASKSRFGSSYSTGGSTSSYITSGQTTTSVPYSGGTYRSNTRTVQGSTNTPVADIPMGTVGRNTYKPVYRSGISNATRGSSTNMRYNPAADGGGTSTTTANTAGNVVYNTTPVTSSTGTVQGSGNSVVYTAGSSVPMANKTTTVTASKSRGGNNNAVTTTTIPTTIASSTPTTVGNYTYTNSSGRTISVSKSQLGLSNRTYKKEELPRNILPYDPNRSYLDGRLINTSNPQYSTTPSPVFSNPSTNTGSYYSPYIPPATTRRPAQTRPAPARPAPNNRKSSSVTSEDGGRRNVVAPPAPGKTKVTEIGQGNLDDALDAYLNSYETTSTTVNTDSSSPSRTELTKRQKKRLIKKLKRDRNK